MNTEAKQDEVIEVKEEVDGSAVVDLPESIPNPDKEKEDNEKEEVEAAAGGEVDDQDDPDDTEAVRAARRERRWVAQDVVFKADGQVNEFAGHDEPESSGR